MRHPKTQPLPKAARLPAQAQITPIDLPGLDNLSGDAVGLFCWSDVRPLAGVAGYVDWRVCGALSQTIHTHVFAGELSDVLMVPVSGRFGPRRIFLFGLGPSTAWTADTLRESCRRAYDIMRRAGVESVILGAPAVRGDKRLADAFVRAINEELPNQVDQVLLEKV